MVTDAPALVWVLQSDPRLREDRAAAARQLGLLATAVPSPREAIEWAAGPGTTPDVILFDDCELDMSAAEFGTGISEALGELTPPIVYIVSGEGEPEPLPSPPFRPDVDVCLRRPVPEREVLGAVLSLVRRRLGGSEVLPSGAAVGERKRAEEALRASEETYRDLLENANDLIQSVAPDGSFVYVNRAWRETLGYGQEEIPGLSLWDIIHPDSKAHCIEAFQRVMAGEKLDRIEAMFLSKDGRAIMVEGSANCSFRDGKPVATRGIFRDITERKRAEEALRESEQRLREVLEVSRDYVYKHNLETGNYEYISPAALQVTGFTPEEIIAMGFEEAQSRVHPEDLEPHRAHLENLLSQTAQPAMTPTIQYRWKCKDGQYHWFSDNRALIRDKDGRPVARVGTIRDVTELKRGEESLRRRSHDLGERVRELGCLYGISDLVQTPGISLGEILQGAVDFIPPAWQYPEVTCARIILEGQEFRTENFRETAWRQTSDIVVNGQRIGTVEVCYLEEKPESDEGPFLREERQLIDAIAERLARVIERKRAEEALRENEEKYRRVVEDSIDGIAIAQGLEIRFVNRALLRMFGYESGAEMVGRRFTEFLSPEYRELMAQRLNAREVSECAPGHYEQRAVRKDGREFPIEVSAGTITYDRGRAYQVVIRDITERKRAEEALQKAREELENRVERQMQRGNAYGLTFRELTVLHLVGAGRADKEIGTELGISVQTAQKHVANILSKMDAASRTEASVRAVREGLLD